jgi:hypothetical protein
LPRTNLIRSLQVTVNHEYQIAQLFPTGHRVIKTETWLITAFTVTHAKHHTLRSP